MKNNLYVALRDNKFIQKVSREAEIHWPKKVGKVVKGACWLDRIPHKKKEKWTELAAVAVAAHSAQVSASFLAFSLTTKVRKGDKVP